AEHRLDDRLAPAVDRTALLGSGLARHPLLGGGVFGDRSARRRRLGLRVLEPAGRDEWINPVLLAGLDVLLGEVAGVRGQHRARGSSAPIAWRFSSSCSTAGSSCPASAASSESSATT